MIVKMVFAKMANVNVSMATMVNIVKTFISLIYPVVGAMSVIGTDSVNLLMV